MRAPTIEEFRAMPPVWQLNAIRDLPYADARSLIDQLTDSELAAFAAQNSKNLRKLEQRIESLRVVAKQLAERHEEMMRPPSEPEGYGELPTMHSDREQAQEIDTAMRAAFLAGGIPAAYAWKIAENALRLASLDPDALDAQLAATGLHFREHWGEAFASRLASINVIVDRMAVADARLGALIDAEPGLIYADPLTVDLLDRVAQYKTEPRK